MVCIFQLFQRVLSQKARNIFFAFIVGLVYGMLFGKGLDVSPHISTYNGLRGVITTSLLGACNSPKLKILVTYSLT